jgi:hypothetical protein
MTRDSPSRKVCGKITTGGYSWPRGGQLYRHGRGQLATGVANSTATGVANSTATGVANSTHSPVGQRRQGRPFSSRSASFEAMGCASLPEESRQLSEGGHEEARAKGRCKGECPESRNCRDCKLRDTHEFMLRLMCESGDAMKAMQAGAA